MTNVLDLTTGLYTLYTLGPRDAVIAAYAQNEQRNYNTWTYDQYRKLVTVSESIKPGVTVVTCGNQSCLSRTGFEDVYSAQEYEWTPEMEVEAQRRNHKLREETLRALGHEGLL